MKEKKNPNQPIIWTDDECIRFKKNKIVDYILDVASAGGYTLNNICGDFDVHGKDQDDYKQLMQLIGYSVSGYGDLSTIPKAEVRRADSVAYKMSEEKHKHPLLKKAEEAVKGDDT